MTAAAHYWLGYLAAAIARTLREQDVKPLKHDLAAFLRSEAATVELRQRLREEMRHART